MQLRNLFAFLLSLLFTISLLSCSKNGSPDEALFYGAWKTSYGDTIVFSRENGKNIISYDNSMNPSMPIITKDEFAYKNSKLWIKYSLSSIHDFRKIQSFTWVQEGREFTVQGLEWFNFLSSSLTVFIFTKIQ